MRIHRKSAALPLVAIALLATACGGSDKKSDAGSSAAAAASSAGAAASSMAADAGAMASSLAAAGSDLASSVQAQASSVVAQATSEATPATSAAATGAGTGTPDATALLKMALGSQGLNLSDAEINCISQKAGADLGAQLASGSTPTALIVAIVRCAGDSFSKTVAPSIKQDLPNISDDQANCVAKVTLEALASLSDEEIAAAIGSGTSAAPQKVKDAIIDKGSSQCGVDKGDLTKAIDKA